MLKDEFSVYPRLFTVFSSISNFETKIDAAASIPEVKKIPWIQLRIIGALYALPKLAAFPSSTFMSLLCIF